MAIAQQQPQIATVERDGKQYPQANSRPGLATQPQIFYLWDLLNDRDIMSNPDIRRHIEQGHGGSREKFLAYTFRTMSMLPKNSASNLISSIKLLPTVPKPKTVSTEHATATLVPLSTEQWRPSLMPQTDDVWVMVKGDKLVPRGSYGLETPGSQFKNNITFFSVWCADDGSRWTVRMYVSDERVKLPRTTQYAVLNAIAQNPAEAAALYGHEIGKCGICSRKLTNDESRARGIGPICADKFGW